MTAFDDLVIGSGLSALGAALAAAAAGRRVGIVTGADGALRHYPGTRTPIEHDGEGGLGRYWHGVIPLSLRHRPRPFDDRDWASLLARFYPAAALADHAGAPLLFVPRAPIRPQAVLAGLARQNDRVTLIPGAADRIGRSGGGFIATVAGADHRAARGWIAAGALGTPRLLRRSGLIGPDARSLSDHVISYAGRLSRSAETAAHFGALVRVPGGMLIPARFDEAGDALYTLRPARFDFAPLDAGFAHRAVFGQPAGAVIGSIARSLSPGLVSEALFNKYGLFPAARHYGVYLQTSAAGALTLAEDGSVLRHEQPVLAALARAVGACPFAGMTPTAAHGLYIPGIHLHGSISEDESTSLAGDAMHIIDASTLHDIGPEHHSFAMLTRAYTAGRQVAA